MGRLPYLLLLNFLVRVAVMKPIQWILVVIVLVGMVFSVAFVMQFLGENDKGSLITPQAEREEILVVPETRYPSEMQEYIDLERTQKYGDHDFPFCNPTDESVTVGVNSISCACVRVGILLASEEWKMREAMLVAGQLTATFTQPLLAPGFVAAEMSDPGLRAAASQIKPAVTLARSDDTKGDFTIPPHTVGWFRLSWSEGQNGKMTRSAEVRMKQQAKRAVVRLEVHVRGLDPVQFLAQDYRDQNCTVAELQKKPKELWYTIFSTTRPTLHPKTKLILPPNWKPEQAPVTVGQPQRVPPEEWHMLLEEMARERALNGSPDEKNSPLPQLQCVYRFAVTLHERSADQKHPFPFGLYRYRIRVTFDDENIDPTMCYLSGILTGDVYVAKGKDDRIDLGNFHASEGHPGESIRLYSDVEDLKLEIDRERTPSFLNAEVEPDKTDKTAWILSVRVEPNKIVGAFPRQDEEAYFDTGVYVKTVGDSSRSLRVPVTGTALK